MIIFVVGTQTIILCQEACHHEHGSNGVVVGVEGVSVEFVGVVPTNIGERASLGCTFREIKSCQHLSTFILPCPSIALILFKISSLCGIALPLCLSLAFLVLSSLKFSHNLSLSVSSASSFAKYATQNYSHILFQTTKSCYDLSYIFSSS